MSDIFDEKVDIKNIKSFIAALRKQYEDELHSGVPVINDIDEIRMRYKLTIKWPGDDVVMQIVKDICRLMDKNDLSPGDFV